MRLNTKVIATFALATSIGQSALAQSAGASGTAVTGRPCGATQTTQALTVTPEKVQGYFLMEVGIDQRGVVHHVRVISGPDEFRASAIKATKRWKRDPPPKMDGSSPRRQTTLMVTLIKGAKPRIVEGMPAGVSGCLPVPQRVRVSQSVMESRLLSRVEPVYPLQAKADRIEGVIVMWINVDKVGDVSNVTILSGPPSLVSAAVDAVKQWKYQPYLLNGEPIEAETKVEVSFKL